MSKFKENVNELFDNWNTIPNWLSFLRIALIPVFSILFIKEKYIPAFVLMIIAALTDLIDGKIARKYIMVIGGGLLLAKGLRPVAAEMWGKVATTVFYIFMIAIIAIGPNGALVGHWFFKALPTPVIYGMVIISVILAFVSLFGYAPGFIKQIKENKSNK